MDKGRKMLARRRGPGPAAPMRPSYEAEVPLELAELPPTGWDMANFLNAHNDYLRRYRLGECSVLVTKEFGRWHLSIAHPRRYPTWDEVAEARYRLLPNDLVAAMILPPKEAYINLHSYCFQVHEIDDQGFGPPEGGPACARG